MSSNRLNQSLTIDVKASIGKYLLIIIPHLFIAVLLSLFLNTNELNLFYLIILLFGILISLGYFINLHTLFKCKRSIHEIHKSESGVWMLKLDNDVTVEASVLTSSFVSNILIILNYRDEFRKQYTAMITSDSISADQYRKLKVYLKTHKQVV